MFAKMSNKLALLLMSALIAGCGGLNSGGSSAGGSGSGNIFGGKSKTAPVPKEPKGKKTATTQKYPVGVTERRRGIGTQLKLGDLLNPSDDNADIRVNKYLWEAALETLSFLPIEAADPFSGILVMGWGRAPGSGTDFRATVLIQDPALEAGSLKIAMQKRNGPASAETNRRIEDAVLTRARQLRIRAAKRR